MTGDRAEAPPPHADLVQRAKSYEASFPWVKVTDGRHWVQLATPSHVCFLRAQSYFTKEPETIRWIAGIPGNGVLFDVGANIGLYTLWAAITRQVKVFAFEPEARNYATLNLNLRANGLSERCLAFCVGVTDRVGFDALHTRRAAVGDSGHQVGRRHSGSIAQGIVTTTLDHLVYEAGLPCPSHLKIDVDGLEPAIINGASRLLSDQRLKSILVELYVKDPEHLAVIDRLTDLGFAKDEDMERAVHAKTAGVKYTGNIIFSRPQ